MFLIRNEHVAAAADIIQQRFFSRDRLWCEDVALAALNAARAVDMARGKKLARDAINPDVDDERGSR